MGKRDVTRHGTDTSTADEGTLVTTFTANGLDLYDALANVLPHVGKEDTLPVLTCVRVEVDEDGLVTLVGTDRYSLGAQDVPREQDTPFTSGAFLLPRDTAASVQKLAKTAKCPITVSTDSDESGSVTVAALTGEQQVARVQIGDFPKWRSLLPDSNVEPVATENVGLGTYNVAKVSKWYRGGRVAAAVPLVFTFRGPTKPVVVTTTDTESTWRALLMPVRLGEK